MIHKKNISSETGRVRRLAELFSVNDELKKTKRFLENEGEKIEFREGHLIIRSQENLNPNAIHAHEILSLAKNEEINFGQLFEALNITTKQAARELLTKQKMTNDDIEIIISQNPQLEESPQTSDTRPREAGGGGAAAVSDSESIIDQLLDGGNVELAYEAYLQEKGQNIDLKTFKTFLEDTIQKRENNEELQLAFIKYGEQTGLADKSIVATRIQLIALLEIKQSDC